MGEQREGEALREMGWIPKQQPLLTGDLPCAGSLLCHVSFLSSVRGVLSLSMWNMMEVQRLESDWLKVTVNVDQHQSQLHHFQCASGQGKWFS